MQDGKGAPPPGMQNVFRYYVPTYDCGNGPQGDHDMDFLTESDARKAAEGYLYRIKPGVVTPTGNTGPECKLIRIEAWWQQVTPADMNIRKLRSMCKLKVKEKYGISAFNMGEYIGKPENITLVDINDDGAQDICYQGKMKNRMCVLVERRVVSFTLRTQKVENGNFTPERTARRVSCNFSATGGLLEVN